ncbi:MAG TPA: hypothetical protein VMZ29_09275 [Candidatus Bathyarchaeia archaeon]|nr:hypothetical protein [Candidatus Bathyarchaeia archaeon]
MNEQININVKLIAEKKENFQILKKNRFAKRFFGNQVQNSITNVQIQTTPSSAFIIWDSNAENFDIIIKGNNYQKGETVQAKAYHLYDLIANEKYSFSIRTQNGVWQDYSFVASYQDELESSGIQHKFTLMNETITNVSNQSKWVFEQTLAFDTKQIARFSYENNDTEKWHVELILNDKIVATSNKSKINCNIRIGNYVITPIKSLTLQNRVKMLGGSQLTGLLRRNPDENLLQLEQQDFPESETLEVDEEYKEPDSWQKYQSSLEQNYVKEADEKKKKRAFSLFG